VAEIHALLYKKSAQKDVPLWEIVEKKRAARLQYAYALLYPGITPFQVFPVRSFVISFAPVFFSEIERWISKNSVDYFTVNKGKYVRAVPYE
jgi:hypothetical protein